MPIYEYQCDKCHHHLEALQKYSDKPLRECPECGKHALRRLMSAPRFRLAGSGWYETDFKSDNESKRNLVEKEKGEAPAPVASTSETTAEKPAATPEKSGTKEASGTSNGGEGESKRRPIVTKPDVASKSASKSAAKPRPKVAARKPAPRKPVVRNR